MKAKTSWTWKLRMINRKNPVPKCSFHDLDSQKQKRLAWAQCQNYLILLGEHQRACGPRWWFLYNLSENKWFLRAPVGSRAFYKVLYRNSTRRDRVGSIFWVRELWKVLACYWIVVLPNPTRDDWGNLTHSDKDQFLPERSNPSATLYTFLESTIVRRGVIKF